MRSSPLLFTHKGWLALLAVSLIPILYSAFYLGAFWNPYGHLDRMTAAVINQDQGRDAALVIRQLRHDMRIRIVSLDQAENLLRRGSVAAQTIMIPAGYTRALHKGHVVPLVFTMEAANNYLGALLIQREDRAIELALASHYRQRTQVGLSQASRSAHRLSSATKSLSHTLSTLQHSSLLLSHDARGLTHESALLARSTGGRTAFAGDANRVGKGAVSLQGGLTHLGNGISTAQSQSGKISTGMNTLAKNLSKASTVGMKVFGHIVIRHPVNRYGLGLAPYFVALSLWVGVLVSTVLIPGGTKEGLLLRQRVSWGIAVLQSLFLAVGLFVLLPFSTHNTLAFWGALALIATAWWATIRMLTEKLGDAGRIVAIALLVIQLAGSGGTYPMTLSSAFFATIHPWLPMTWAVNLLRYTISSGLTPLAHLNAIRLIILAIMTWGITRWIPGRLAFETPPLIAGRKDK